MQAQRDDIVPLFTPLTLADGTTTDRVHIKKGTVVSLHGEVIDTSTALWGADAHEFRPNRWLTALPEGAQAVSGYHHLMTFGDGPKACASLVHFTGVYADRSLQVPWP
jgi:cytochrome P450